MYPYFYIGRISISAWWLFLVCGYVAASLGLILTRPKDFSISYGKITLSILIFIPASIAGSEILSFLIHYKSFAGLTYQEALNNTGAASIGGLVLGIVSLWILSKIARFSFVDSTDFGMPYMVLTLAFNRIGCTLAGCCYGIPTSLPWGFRFLEDGILRHPTQAYAMACAFAVFGGSRFIYKNLSSMKGLVSFYVVLSYSFLRFFNAFFRAEGPHIIGQFKIIHVFLLALIGVSIYYIIKILKAQELGARERAKRFMKLSVIRVVLWFFCSVIFPLMIIHVSSRIWFN